MTVHTYVDMSTAHVSRATMRILETADADTAIRHGWPAMTIAPYKYGVFITVPWIDDADKELQVSAREAATLPLELTLVLAYARRQGATVVRLDADGEEIEGLQTFDW